jgi:ATP-dependent helicase/DNAse subunit B
LANEKRVRIRVLVGPARSGKTERVTRLFCDAAGADRSALIIVPGAVDARAMRLRLLRELPFLSRSPVITFVALAEQVLAAAGVRARPVAAEARELILRSITARLAEKGRLSFFADSLHMAGLYGELLSFIRELKAWQIEPDTFERFPTWEHPRDRDLAAIYREYQDALRTEDLYDAEGRFWEARIRLVETPPRFAPELLLLDGFTDFTPNEISLLGAFAGYVDEVVLTLPGEKSGREDLFAKTRGTIERLERDFEVTCDYLTPAGASSATAAIAARLFSDDDGRAIDSGGAVRVIEAAGASLEVREVARRAKRLVLCGTDPRDIAVVARQARQYAPLARDAFDEMGVPLDLGAGMARSQSGLFALLRSLVDVVETDFERAAVLKIIASPYVDLAAGLKHSATPAEAAAVAREAGVVSGLSQWRARLAALSNAALDRVEEDGEETADAAFAEAAAGTLAMVERLADAVAPLRGMTAAADMAEGVSKAFTDLGVREQVLAEGAPEAALYRDLAAYAALEEALGGIARERRREGRVDLRAFVRLLSETVEGEGLSDGRVEGGGVSFMEAAAARNLSFKIVFLVGLTADAFPRRLPVGPFYDRAERQALSRHGLGARDEEMHLSGERLLFYQAATRAEETLYLSYPATDEEGKGVLTSFYVEELLRLFSLPEGDHQRFGPSRKIAPLDEAASPGEVAVALGAGIRSAESVDAAARLARAARAHYGAFGEALRSAIVEARRDSLDELGRFDGVLSAKAAESVARRFSRGRPWSATRLNDYAVCPFVFFLRQVLGAERGEEPGMCLSNLDKGILAHRVLARYFREMAKAGFGVDRVGVPTAADESLDEFDRISNGVMDAFAAARGFEKDGIWIVERARFGRVLREFVTFERSRFAMQPTGVYYRPTAFEYSFGREDDDWAKEVCVGDETITGRIDRIDRRFECAPGEAPREAGSSIVDYKLSRAPSGKTVLALGDLQMPLYLYAARETGAAEPMEALYLTIRDGAKPSIALSFDRTDETDAFLATFEEELARIAGAVRSGAFAAAPPGECQRRCDGRGVCRYRSSRVEFLRERREGDEA